MASLKDTIINGALRVIGSLFAGKIQTNTINIPTASGGTTYGPGTNGQVIKSNGTNVYWASDSNTDTKVTQTVTTTSANYPLLLAPSGQTATTTTTANFGTAFQANPSTGNLQATKFNGYTLAAASAKGVDTSITASTTSTNLPTSAAVESRINAHSGIDKTGTVTSIATSGVITGGTITSTGTISHANSGVTAATYKSVTVNATGHVTAGTNPTTLAGYGITDANVDTSTGLLTLGSNTWNLIKNIKDGSSTGSIRGTATTAESSTYTMGQYAAAFGYDTQAKGKYSFAEGRLTRSLGAQAHAEGYNTIATGGASHTEGGSTEAGDYAHAEGDSTKAYGVASHTEGIGNEAYTMAQHVIGMYNVPDGDIDSDPEEIGEFIEVVGNGTSEDDRSNARVIDWSGNERIAGKLKIGSTGTGGVDLRNSPVGKLQTSFNNGSTWMSIMGRIKITATSGSAYQLKFNNYTVLTITANTTISLEDTNTANNAPIYEYCGELIMGSTLYSITWASPIATIIGPTIAANKTYLFSIMFNSIILCEK